MSATVDFMAGLADMDDAEIAALAYLSPAYHFASFVTIRDAGGNTIRPKPNILQLRMSEAYETLRDLGVKVRLIVVKPRRAGCSSFASHIVYHHGQRFACEGITISDVKGHSAELMGKVKDYTTVDLFPWGNRMTNDTAHSLAWDNGTKWTIDSAENPDAGVGGTRQLGHFSEVSKWPKTAQRNDKRTMAAVLPSLSGQGTVAIAESTPEGAMGWMYDTWCEAWTLDHYLEMFDKGFRPEEQWVKVFAAWFEFDENQRQTPVSEVERKHLEATLDNDERDGIEKWQWTWEQIAWRRDTIKSVCNGDPKVFQFYYPSDEISCWTASGAPRFDMGRLLDMEAIAKGIIPDTGYLVQQDSGYVTFHPVRDGSGEILIYEEPQEGFRYLVTGDPATGESQTVGEDPDASSVLLLRKGYFDSTREIWRPARVVARVRGGFRGDDDVMAGHMVRLSKFYGNALCVLEVNQGLQVLRCLLDAGAPLFKRRPESAKTREQQEQYGFKLTDREQRRMIIEGLAAAIRENEIDVPDLHVIGELKTFIVKPDGRAEAANGRHDDDVMALAMGWECLPSAGEYKIHKLKQKDPSDRKSWRSVSNVKRGW